MDPSIMKLLEEDEDESMHSGADVEAFTAALNRDIEGGGSCSQPSQSDTPASQESNQMSRQMYSQWQSSSQDENSTTEIKQQDLRNQEHQSSEIGAKEPGSSVEGQREVNGSTAPSGPSMQYKPVQAEGQGHKIEQNSADFAQASAGMQMQISGMGHAQIHDSDRMFHPGSESQFSNMQRFGNQPVPVAEQVNNPANRTKQIPFGSLLPIILPELDKDRAMQLQTLYTKLRRNEIPKDGFVRHMRTLVGDQMLRLAVVKMQAKGNKNPETGPNQFQVQSQSPMQQHQMRPSTGTAAQFSDPYSFGQLHQKGQTTPMTVPLPSRSAASVMQPQKDSAHQIVDSKAFKSREMEHLPDSHANQMSDRSAISIQGLTKQQQQHLHFSQCSFPMYGTGNYHPFGTNVGTSSTMVKPQPHEPQMRQVHLHQGFGSTHADGASQAMNAMSVPKVERQNSYSDPKRVLGSTMSSMSPSSMPHNSVPWQPMISKEPKSGALPSTGYVKQEPVEQVHEKQSKPPNFSSPSPTFLGPPQVDQGKAVPGNTNEELSERQHSGMSFPPSTRATTMAPSSSVSPQMTASDTEVQVGTQNTSASPMGAIGGNAKAVAKKPSTGQKKPLDAHTSSPPLPSKKQKVSGAFSDQSIEHLNDVTAVSGVNLREEEEQLFSGPKDDSRVSEASRKAVQEEEDRLILQKIPLQKKLAEIMTKCGLKNLSSDVERCLSLCVEERLCGLISSLIRVSKQRADLEKSRHNTVVTSDVREQILAINQKAREEWEKKQAEAEKLQKPNEPDGSAGLDGDKEKDEGRGKALKANKEEDDKMRTTAANVAARAAVGGDDMLSKWQLMAQARQKRDGGPETASTSQMGKDANQKSLGTSSGNARDRGAGKKDQPAGPSASGVVRQFGRSQVSMLPPRVARSISIKDVIAVLEREPQMAKSTVVYQLYERMRGDAAVE